MPPLHVPAEEFRILADRVADAATDFLATRDLSTRHSGPVASGQASSHYADYSVLASIRSFRVVDIALKLPLGYPHDERLG